MDDTTTIRHGDHHLKLTGTMHDDGELTVKLDGDTRTIHPRGTVDDGIVTYEVTTPNGVHVFEAPTKQTIEFPDGLEITKRPDTCSVTLPDGTSFTDRPAFDNSSETDDQIVNQESGTISKSSTSIRISTKNTTVEHSSSKTTTETTTETTTDGGKPSAPKSVRRPLLAGALTIWAATLLGIGNAAFQLPAICLIIVSLLLYPKLSDTIEALPDPINQENTEPDLSETERQENQIKDAYVAGDLTHEEFESRLDRLHFEDESTPNKDTTKEPAFNS